MRLMEGCIVQHVQGSLKRNNSSTRSFMFTSRSEGGLSILNPSALYSAKHLSFRLSVLNSDDEQVRDTARSSLALHMQKRKVPEAPTIVNAFCGFQTSDEGNLAKTWRVTWPRSDWGHMNEVCAHEGVVCEKRIGVSFAPTLRLTLNTKC
ncbi:hypothetical protein ACOMHN_049238 [Nucella lapillus]